MGFILKEILWSYLILKRWLIGFRFHYAQTVADLNELHIEGSGNESGILSDRINVLFYF
jgi:hypothetical protein